MWKIEALKMNQGGIINEGDQFRLKNVRSNLYLMVKDTEDRKGTSSSDNNKLANTSIGPS